MAGEYTPDQMNQDALVAEDYMRRMAQGGWEPGQDDLFSVRDALQRATTVLDRGHWAHGVLGGVERRLADTQNPMPGDEDFAPPGSIVSPPVPFDEGSQTPSADFGPMPEDDILTEPLDDSLTDAPIIETEPQETEVPGITLSPGVAWQRALKHDFALGPISPGLERLYQSLNDPMADELERQRANVILNEQRRIGSQRLVQDLVLAGRVDDAEAVALNSPRPDDSRTIYEQLYASRLLESALTFTPSSWGVVESAFRENQDTALDTISFAENIIARKEVFQRITEEFEQRFRSSPWYSNNIIGDTVEQFVPFLSWYRLYSADPESVGASFIGTAMRNIVQRLWVMPLDEAETEARRIIEALYRENTLDAFLLARALTGFSDTEEVLGNLVSVADIGSVLLAPASVARTISRTRRLAGATRSIISSATGRNTRVSEVLEAAGDTSSAARTLIEEVAENPRTAPRAFTELRGQVMSLHNPDEIISRGRGNALSRLEVQRLERLMTTNRDRLEQSVTGIIELPRLSDEALEVAAKETGDLFRFQYPHLNDRILNVRPLLIHERGTNVDYIGIQLGNAEGRLFENVESAETTARDFFGLTDFNIGQRGTGYFIEVQKAIDETAPSVRGFLSHETKNVDPTNRGLTAQIRTHLFGPEGLLPRSLQELRYVTAYATSGLERRFRDVIKPLIKVRSNKDFTKFINRQRDHVDSSTKERGRFSQTQFEFEEDWLAATGRMPTATESEAYWTYVQLYDFDWVLRNMSIYRDKTRLGFEMVSFGESMGPATWRGPQGVEARLLPSLPWDATTNARILVLDDQGVPTLMWLKGRNTRERIEAMEGVRVFQPSRYGDPVLRQWLDENIPVATMGARFDRPREVVGHLEFGANLERPTTPLRVDSPDVSVRSEPGQRIILDEPSRVKGTSRTGVPHVDYIVTRHYDSRRLPFKQIPRRPGGHVAYPHSSWYVSVPDVRTSRIGGARYNYYYGDSNKYHFLSRTQAQKYVERVNDARKLMLAGKEEELAAFLRTNFPDDLTPARFKREFQGPAFLKAHNRSLADDHKLQDSYANFVRMSDNEHNPFHGQVGLQYAEERSLPIRTIQEPGSQTNPTFKFIPATTLDPLGTIDSAVGQLVRGRYMDDLKVASAERFIAEFHPVLDIPLAEARRNPLGALLDAPFKEGVTDADALAAARAYRRTAIEFFGTRTPLQNKVRVLSQKLVDSLDQSGSRDPLKESWLLRKERNPVTFWKNSAFGAYLGMFNPRQLFLQASTAINSAAIIGNPLITARAATIAVGIRPLLINSERPIRNHLIKMLNRSTGVSVKHLDEALESYQRTGLWHVGREVAYREAMMGTNVVPTKTGAFFNETATVFFNEGERFNRSTAWFSSYLEWRRANPKAALTDRVIIKLVARTNALTANMSTASRATWERGLTSIPLQFLSYRARLADQMIFGGGRQLTGWERARLYGTYATLWGFPITAGASIFPLWPWHEEVRERLLQEGVNVEDNMIIRTMVGGVSSLLQAAIGGEEMNISESFGPGGDTILRDLISGRKTTFEFLGGPTGQLLNRALQNLGPFGMAMLGTIRGDKEAFPLTMQDFSDLASIVSTWRNVERAYFAFHTGEYVSKNGIQTDELTGFNALQIGILGLRPQDLETMDSMIHNMRQRRDYGRRIGRQAIREYRAAWRAMGESRDEDGQRHLTRATAWLAASGLNIQEKYRIFQEASRGHETMLDSVSRRFMRTSPEAFDAFIRRRQGER